MTAVRRDLIIEAGATWSDVFVWATGATEETSTPVNLSGYTARMQIRVTQDATTAAATLTPTLGGAAGTVTTTLTAAQTNALDFTGAPDGFVTAGVDANGIPIVKYGFCAVYDIELVSGDTVVRCTEGTVCLSKQVTR